MPTLIKEDTESTVLGDSVLLQILLSLGEKPKLVTASFFADTFTFMAYILFYLFVITFWSVRLFFCNWFIFSTNTDAFILYFSK